MIAEEGLLAFKLLGQLAECGEGAKLRTHEASRHRPLQPEGCSLDPAHTALDSWCVVV